MCIRDSPPFATSQAIRHNQVSLGKQRLGPLARAWVRLVRIGPGDSGQGESRAGGTRKPGNRMRIVFRAYHTHSRCPKSESNKGLASQRYMLTAHKGYANVTIRRNPCQGDSIMKHHVVIL